MKKRNIIVMILLTLITCGIYNLFWMYLSRDEFKDLSGDDSIRPGLELFFCLICFIYMYYWIYKFSADIAKYQAQHGLPVKDNSVLNLILMFFGLGFVSELLIQDQLNDLA